MSYILDALKKSEQERGHGNVPDVQTVHSSSLNYRNDKKAYWPYILIVAVILNLLAISYFIVNKEKPAQLSRGVEENMTRVQDNAENTPNTGTPELPAPPVLVVEKNTPTETSEPLPVSAGTTTGKSVIVAAPETKPTIRKEQVATETVSNIAEPQAASTNGSEVIIDFHELPESIKRQIPTITISAHVYSSNPMQRSIVINNNFMEEREYILDDLILHEITRDGAVFNYQGTLFNYSVVSGWQ